MNSKKQKDEKSKLTNGSPKQQSNSKESDTILVENKSVLNQSVIEIVDMKATNNSPKLANSNMESNKSHDNNLSGLKLKRKLSTAAMKAVDPCFLQHFPQLTGCFNFDFVN